MNFEAAEMEKKRMTRNEAYKSFKCWHCPHLDRDAGECLCGDPESDDCPKYTKGEN